MKRRKDIPHKFQTPFEFILDIILDDDEKSPRDKENDDEESSNRGYVSTLFNATY